MEYKKGFTLVEITIVIFIMGILALIIVPILTISFQNISFKATYKRAFNIITTLTGIEISQGNFLINTNPDENYLKAMHDTIIRNVSFKDYYDEESNETFHKLPENPNYSTLWINTEDGISYKIQGNSNNSKANKSTLNTLSTMEELSNAALYYIITDVNGFKKGPNCTDPKTTTGLEEEENYNILKCDRYPIFIATDGAAAGHRTKTITGRFIGETNFKL